MRRMHRSRRRVHPKGSPVRDACLRHHWRRKKANHGSRQRVASGRGDLFGHSRSFPGPQEGRCILRPIPSGATKHGNCLGCRRTRYTADLPGGPMRASRCPADRHVTHHPKESSDGGGHGRGDGQVAGGRHGSDPLACEWRLSAMLGLNGRIPKLGGLYLTHSRSVRVFAPTCIT